MAVRMRKVMAIPSANKQDYLNVYVFCFVCDSSGINLKGFFEPTVSNRAVANCLRRCYATMDTATGTTPFSGELKAQEER